MNLADENNSCDIPSHTHTQSSGHIGKSTVGEDMVLHSEALRRFAASSQGDEVDEKEVWEIVWLATFA